MKISFDVAVQVVIDNRQNLSDELSKYDKAICDFYHLFEFGDFPDNVLLELHKRFVDTLHKRRICKDKYAIAQGIGDKTLVQRYYSPRILVDDFIQYQEYLNI